MPKNEGAMGTEFPHNNRVRVMYRLVEALGEPDY